MAVATSLTAFDTSGVPSSFDVARQTHEAQGSCCLRIREAVLRLELLAMAAAPGATARSWSVVMDAIAAAIAAESVKIDTVRTEKLSLKVELPLKRSM